MKIFNHFGRNLKELRASTYETQDYLAQKVCYVDRTAVSNWERGLRMPDDDMVQLIAGHYDVTQEDLVNSFLKRSDDVSGGFTILKKEECYSEDDGTEILTPIIDAKYTMLPRIGVENSTAFQLYKKAYAIDLSLDNRTGENAEGDRLINMVHKYWDAFDLGMEEAGVNLLRYIFLAKLNAKAAGEDDDRLCDKLMALIDGLKLEENPAGEYYEALCMIWGIIHNGKDDEENFEDGLRKLYELEEDGNIYAMQSVDSIGESDDSEEEE